MKAAVLLCVLGVLVKGDTKIWKDIKDKFNWNSLPGAGGDDSSNSRGSPSSGGNNNNNNQNVCKTDQAACGCCLMQQQIDRLQKSFKETIQQLNQSLSKSTENLNHFRSDRTAFSVALAQTGDYGPFRDDETILYKHEFLNLGGHYNSTTGKFLVPQSGVYSLALTVYGDAKGPGNTLNACASLRVNKKQVLRPSENNQQDQEDSTTGTIILKLNKKDKVSVVLPRGCFLHDDSSHYNTFSAFLLYATD